MAKRAAFATVLLLLAVGTVPVAAQAQDEPTYVGNTGVFGSISAAAVGFVGASQSEFTTSFTTGDDAAGYPLFGVDVFASSIFSDSNPRVSIYTTTAGLPDSPLHVLTSPASLTQGALNTFTAAPGAMLEPNTTYAVVLQQAGTSGRWAFSIINSGNEDPGAANGWSIGNEIARRDVANTTAWSSISGFSMRFAIKGPDITGPVPVSATTDDASVFITFNEDLESFYERLPDTVVTGPQWNELEVTVDGRLNRFYEVQALPITPKQVELRQFESSIRSGQVVRVRYTDRSPDDDTHVIEDDDGNDAASFSLGPDSGDLFEVKNQSTLELAAPSPPHTLRAEAINETSIRLSWDPHPNNGGRPVTGYHIEYCTSSCSGLTSPTWTVLVNDTGNTDTTYIDTGLTSGTTRWYRVAPINEIGTGHSTHTESGPVSATTMAGIGQIAFTLSRESVNEGGSLTWRVTATTLTDTQPDADLEVMLRVEDQGVEYGATVAEDYDGFEDGEFSGRFGNTRTDITFVQSDFSRQTVQTVNGINRYIATKSGRLRVIDDVTVEWAEEIKLSLRSPNGSAEGWDLVTNEASATIAMDSKDRVGFKTTVTESEVSEGESKEVTITITTLPEGEGCVLPFPYTLRPEWTGQNGATYGRPTGSSGDFEWHPDVSRNEFRGGRTRCEKKEQSWTTRMDAYADNEEEDGESIAVTTHFESSFLQSLANERSDLVRQLIEGPLSAENVQTGRSAEIRITEPPPTGLTATAIGGTQIQLAWRAPRGTGAATTGYRVQWSNDGSTRWNDLETNTGTTRGRTCAGRTPSSGVAYCDSGLESDTTRYYRVAAVKSSGTGAYSDTASATTEDIAGPVPVSARVTSNGLNVIITFNEDLELFDDPALYDANVLGPQWSEVELTIDGTQLAFQGITVYSDPTNQVFLHSFRYPVRRGQVVRFRYTDPSTGDDTFVIQDDDGNDAASFSLGPDSGDLFKVRNQSERELEVPDEPDGLRAEAINETSIRLSWIANEDEGGRPITGYYIEYCTSSCSRQTSPTWTVLVNDTGNTDTTYIDTGLTSGTTRWYRVSAINEIGTGRSTHNSTGPRSATTMAGVGQIALTLSPESVNEGGSLTWRVTATTLTDTQPDGDLEVMLRVEDQGVEYGATVVEDYDGFEDGDFSGRFGNTRTDITFVQSDFSRRTVDGNQRYVATKSGTLRVIDDVAVEWAEEVKLSLRTLNGSAGGWDVVADEASATIAMDSKDRVGFKTTVTESEVSEGESKEVTITITTLPEVEGCVLPFPYTLRPEWTGQNGVTYGRSGDFEWHPDVSRDGSKVVTKACGEKEHSWTTRMDAYADSEEDDGESIAVTTYFESRFLQSLADERSDLVQPLMEGPLSAENLQTAGRSAEIRIEEARAIATNVPETLEIREGESDTYTVRLTTRPSGDVTVRPMVTGNTVNVSPATLTFTRSNWDQEQPVTVRATRDGNPYEEVVTITHQVRGADYGSARTASVRVKIIEGPTRRGEVRLEDKRVAASGGVVGRLEVGYHGEWGTVCEDRIQEDFNKAPMMACRMMGYETGKVVRNQNSAAFNARRVQDPSSYPPGSWGNETMPIWLDDLRCYSSSDHWTQGRPTRLDQCYHAGVGGHNCGRDEDVWLECSGTLPDGEPVLPEERQIGISNAFGYEAGTCDPSQIGHSLDDLENCEVIEEAGAPLRFVVMMRPALTGTEEVTVNWRTADFAGPQQMGFYLRRPATADADYTAANGTITFSQTETPAYEERGLGPVMVQTIEVEVLDDEVNDSGEVFRVVLSDVTGDAVIQNGSAYGLIYNDEFGAVVNAQFAEVPAEHQGEPFTVELRFEEAVEATAAGIQGALSAENGTVTGVTQRDEGDSRYWTIAVTPANGEDDTTVSLPPSPNCVGANTVCSSDGRKVATDVSTTVAADASFEAVPTVSGAAQAGRSLTAAMEDDGGGAFSWQWLRGDEAIEGATSSEYTPVTADVGHALKARATRGSTVATSEPTQPVWTAAKWPGGKRGEAGLLSTGLTLGSTDELRTKLGGYANVGNPKFGSIDASGFSEDGTAYTLLYFGVNAGGEFALATDPPISAEGLVAYWNDKRIDAFQIQTAPSGEQILKGEIEFEGDEATKYTDGSTDGVRVAVTLRRTYEVARVVQAWVSSGPGENGTWDTGERIEAKVRFNVPVQIRAEAGEEHRRVEIVIDNGRSSSPRVRHTEGSGTDTITFAHTVGEAGDGATQARLHGDRLLLNGLEIVDMNGRAAETSFSPSPQAEAAAVTDDASADRVWTNGETLEVRLTYSEAVTVEGGTPTIGITIAGDESTLGYTGGSGTKTLVFARDVAQGERLEQIAIAADSLVLNGATIASEANGMHAAPGNPGTEATSAPEETTALTATFTGLPENHGGAAFTFELAFSENLAEDFSYRTLADALSATNAAVTSTVRIVKEGAERNRRWQIGITPTGSGDVTVALAPSPACGETGSICTADARALEAGVSATVPHSNTPEQGEPAFTVALSEVPGEHDGENGFNLKLTFSKEPKSGYSYVTLRDESLSVSQGENRLTPKVQRLNKPHNDRWEVTVTPAGKADIAVSIGPKASCEAAGAVCTDADEALSNTATATILGPPGLEVADAEVREAPGATMDFVVTLGRASTSEITVEYETGDGTATAGEDYTATSGTLTFTAGETSKTVAVPVLVDAVDDDGETFTLTLDNASGGNAYIKDGTATGTIHNTGPMPQAWLVRFGRTIASQAVDAIGGRLENGGGANHVQVGGIALTGAGRMPQEDENQRLGIDDIAWNPVDDTRSMTGRELLMGSAFSLGAGGEQGAPLVGAWGRVELGNFDAEEDGLVLDGEVTTGFLGADVARGRWLAGLAMSFSSGDGSFRIEDGEHSGTVESDLTSVYPYARLSLNDRVSTWGLVGLGTGELTLRHAQEGMPQATLVTDTSMRMGALGVRGEVLTPAEAGGLTVAIRSDAFWVRMKSEDVEGMRASEGEASRIRLIVEGSRAFDTGSGSLTPSAEIGVRHDGGDAETGAGLEVGGRIRYEQGSFALEGSVRALVAHEESGYEEWGASGSLRIQPRASGRGLSLTIAPSAGNAGSGTGTLWSARDPRALAPEDAFKAGRRLEAEVGYGVGGPRATGLVTPYAGLSLGEDGNRTWRTGTRWQLAPEATFGLEATRNEAQSESGAANAVQLRGEVRW